jgi:hypothetical protein
MLASSFATITASGLHKSISREPGQAIRSQVAHTRRAAKFILYFIQLVLYAFGALENFALTISDCGSRNVPRSARNCRGHHANLSAHAGVRNARDTRVKWGVRLCGAVVLTVR